MDTVEGLEERGAKSGPVQYKGCGQNQNYSCSVVRTWMQTWEKSRDSIPSPPNPSIFTHGCPSLPQPPHPAGEFRGQTFHPPTGTPSISLPACQTLREGTTGTRPWSGLEVAGWRRRKSLCNKPVLHHFLSRALSPSCSSTSYDLWSPALSSSWQPLPGRARWLCVQKLS